MSNAWYEPSSFLNCIFSSLTDLSLPMYPEPIEPYSQFRSDKYVSSSDTTTVLLNVALFPSLSFTVRFTLNIPVLPSM